VGANILTELVTKVVNDVRARDETPSPDAIESALTTHIEAALRGHGGRVEALRAEIASLFREIDAVGVASATAIDSGDQELQEAIATTFVALSAQFDEFAFVVGDVRQAVWAVEESLRRQEAEDRASRERAREYGVTMRLILNKVETIEARTGSRGGTIEATDSWDGCPYLGLSSFEERHAGVFFGREALTAQLLQRFAEQLTGQGPLVVLGAYRPVCRLGRVHRMP
jgi:hypothetical protein